VSGALEITEETAYYRQFTLFEIPGRPPERHRFDRLRPMPKIKFVKEKKEIEVESGANLRKVALHEGIELYPGIHQYVNCLGFGQCASCRVRITKGVENVSPAGWWEKLRLLMPDTFFARLGHEQDMRLACKTAVNGDIEVETKPEGNLYGDRFWG
jgi:ferredoxin